MSTKECWHVQRIAGFQPFVFTTEQPPAAMTLLESLIHTTLEEGPVPASINLLQADEAGNETLLAHIHILQTIPRRRKQTQTVCG